MTLLCHLPGCRIHRVVRDGPTSLLVAAQARRDASRCPACSTLSTSIHSRYRRQPADLPVSGCENAMQLWREARDCGVRVVESFAANLDQDGCAVRGPAPAVEQRPG